MNNRLWPSIVLYACSVFVLQIVLLSPVHGADRELPSGLISPRSGAVCNENVKICYDIFGVSIGITQDIMGQEAADKLTHELSVVNTEDFDRTTFNPVQGISCHTLEKACYEGEEISEPLSSVLFGKNAGKYDSYALLDGPWFWGGSRYPNDTEVAVADGSDYRLSFQADGSLQIQADCNRVLGTYSAEGKSIVIMLGPSTLMACNPDSKDHQFLKDLGGVAVWFLKKGELYLESMTDSGTMQFYRGGGR